MSMPETPRDEVLSLLDRVGPMTRKEMLPQCRLISDGKQLSNTLYQLKQAGHIERGEDRRYRKCLAGKGYGAPTPPPKPAPEQKASEAPAPTKPAPTPPPAAPTGNDDTIHALLARNLSQAQDILDEYVWSVGDPRILKPLMTARDQARAALTAYEEDPS